MQNQQNNPDGGERMIDNILAQFQSLLLNTPNHQNQDQQELEPPPEYFNNEIYDILALPWRQRVPTNEDCEIIVRYFNLNMEMMKNLHRVHIAKSDLLKTLPEILNIGEATVAVFCGTIPPIPTSYQEYIFNCSMCYEMFTMLHISLSSEQGAPVEERQSQARPSSYNGPSRPTSSPVPNLPSTSQAVPDCTNTPLSLDPITPATSSFFSYYEAAQLLAMEVGPNAAPIRVKRCPRINRVTGYLRPQRKYKSNKK